MPDRVRVAVVYHSAFGHTRVLADAICRGVDSIQGCASLLIDVERMTHAGVSGGAVGGPLWDALDASTAIVFGSPTYMGTVSATFKRFMDDSSSRWTNQAWKDKLAAGFTISGGLSGDKLHAMQTLAIFACQHSMIWVSTGIDSNGIGPDNLNRLGGYMGLLAQSDNAPPERSPPPGDRQTAELFGKRIAAVALRWAGRPAPAAV